MATDSGKRFIRTALAVVAVVGTMSAAGYALFAPGGLSRDGGPVPVEIGGPFELTTHERQTLTDRDLKGTPFAVFFGFTHCPEVCPTALWEMSETLKALGPGADRLKVLFVSVDPERDDAQALSLYLQSFDPRIIGLTGSLDEIASVTEAYGAYWQKVELEGGDYTIDHTAAVYLIDAQGRFAGTISYAEDQDSRLAKLERLLGG